MLQQFTVTFSKMEPFQLCRTCIVTSRSSTITSLVRKSAPIVALYWLLNFLFTYWFIREVFPTLRVEDNRQQDNRYCRW